MKITKNNITIELTKDERQTLRNALAILSQIEFSTRKFDIIKQGNCYSLDDLKLSCEILEIFIDNDIVEVE